MQTIPDRARGPAMRPGRAAAVGLALALAAGAAWAIEVPRAEAHQMWVSHGLAALLAAGLGFGLARWPAIAGIAFVALLGYAASRMGGAAVPDELLQTLGRHYPFHIEATGLLPALGFVVGFLGGLTGLREQRRRS